MDVDNREVAHNPVEPVRVRLAVNQPMAPMVVSPAAMRLQALAPDLQEMGDWVLPYPLPPVARTRHREKPTQRQRAR
jgi:hypothetical protein